MIQSLHIQNYAIIEALEMQFSKRLTIITGETGAGKSILLGALGLIMGKRADTKVLYNEDKKCIVEAQFDISSYGLQSFFESNDIDYETETVIRRELTPAGKSRAFINDTPVNLKLLQQLSSALIDLHQQFDTRDINNISFQLRMIDALADNQSLLISYQQLFSQYQANQRQLKALMQQSESATNEMDFINFQLNELNEAELEVNEQERLEEEQARLNNAEDIKRTLGEVFRKLSEEEHSLVGQMQELQLALGQVQQYHSGLKKLYERFQGILVDVEDVAVEFESIAEETEFDGERLEEIQARLDLIYKLQTKHHLTTIDALLELQSQLQNQLNAFGDLSKDIEALQKTLAEQETALYKLARALSKKRRSVVDGFEKRVHDLLAQLSMEHARLKIDIKNLDALGPTGIDDINFLFAPNKGSRFLPVGDVASGGELSRLTLCTKSLVASSIPLPTLVFDEIDTGISGDVALKMGFILHQLSKEHQVVSITHTPQIAVKADAHYFVFKKIKNDRTVTGLKLLEQEERIQEVATMLSGSPPSNSAIENAKELLQI